MAGVDRRRRGHQGHADLPDQRRVLERARASSPAPRSTCSASRSARVTNVRERGRQGRTSRWRWTRGPRSPRRPSPRSSRRSCSGRPTSTSTPATPAGPYLRVGRHHRRRTTPRCPVSTDEVLKELQRTLNASTRTPWATSCPTWPPTSTARAQNLNKLIASAAGTVQLLANKGNDLGQLNGTLAQLTGTLDTDTAQIEQLDRAVRHGVDDGGAALGPAQRRHHPAVRRQLRPGRACWCRTSQPLEADVGTVTTVGRTLDRNLSTSTRSSRTATTSSRGPSAPTTPTTTGSTSTSQTAPGVTGAYLAGLLRDRLAGICRRLVANHSSGLSAAVLATLTPVRQPVVGLLRPAAQRHPDDHQHADRAEQHRHGAVPAAEGAPADRRTRRRARAGSTAAPPAPGAGRRARARPDHDDHTVPPTDHDDDQPCGLLSALLGCPAGLGSGSSGSGSSSSQARALGGLLSHDVTSAPGQRVARHRDATGHAEPSARPTPDRARRRAAAAAAPGPAAQARAASPATGAPRPALAVGPRRRELVLMRARDARAVVASPCPSWPPWSSGSTGCSMPAAARASAPPPPSSATSATWPTGPRCRWPTCPSARSAPSRSTATRPRSRSPSTTTCASPPTSAPPSPAPPSSVTSSSQLNVPKSETGAGGRAPRRSWPTGPSSRKTSTAADVEQFVQAGVGGLRRHLDDRARADHRGRRRRASPARRRRSRRSSTT